MGGHSILEMEVNNPPALMIRVSMFGKVKSRGKTEKTPKIQTRKKM